VTQFIISCETRTLTSLNQFTNLYSPLPRFSSLEGQLQVCAHRYTQGESVPSLPDLVFISVDIVFFVVQISLSGNPVSNHL
jgi:hypothetical protein